MPTWKSNPIPVDGVQVQVHASDEGVVLGKSVQGIYASDLRCSPDQARSIAYALIEAANRAEGKS